MARRVKIKTIKSDIGNDTEDMADMFSSLIGATDGSNIHLHMAHPKFIQMKCEINRFVTIVELINNLPFMDLQQEHIQNNFSSYAVQLRESYDDLFCSEQVMCIDQFMSPISAAAIGTKFADYTPTKNDYADIQKDVLDKFSESYKQVKDHELMMACLAVFDNLQTHQLFIGEKDKLDGDFILRMPQHEFNPFDRIGIIDFHMMYIDDQYSDEDRQDMLVALHKLLVISESVYNVSNKPDIDISEFAEVVRTSLNGLRKQIPRCDGAFNEIMSSIGLLTTNFDGYFKDFSDTGNSTLIIEGFIKDVSNKTTNSPDLTRQFRTILSHYKKMTTNMNMSNNKNAAKIQGLLSMIERKADDIDALSGMGGGAAEEDEGIDPADLATAENDDDWLV